MSSSSSLSASPIILVTGANKGIGFQVVKQLAHKLPAATLLLGTRSLENGQKAIARMKEEEQQHHFDNVRAVELEVTDKASLHKAAEQVKSQYGRLDVLMCNAGVSGGGGESADTVFAVNIVGVHDTMESFLPLLPLNGLIVVTASEVGAWATNELPPELQKTITTPDALSWPIVDKMQADWLEALKGQAHEQPWPPADKASTGPYPMSKAFVIAYLRSFAAQQQQPKLVITCPGYCATDLNHHSGHRPASKGGESVSWPVLHPTEAESGGFYQDGKPHAFIEQVPQWALDGYKKMAEQRAARERAQGGK